MQIAERASVLIDGKAYFSALKDVFSRARMQIVIVGWDFDSDVSLEPDNDTTHQPVGAFLRSLVEANPSLRVHLLIWRNSLFYGSNDEPLMPFGDRWWRHPRIEFNLDCKHPLAASHHQKIVCVDGSIAFCGGMDITQRRWDDENHSFRNPDRHDADGDPSRPVHDVQIMVNGPAARSLWEVASQRWALKAGNPLDMVSERLPWPKDLKEDFNSQPICISRTFPQYRSESGIREIDLMNLDLLRSAKRFIYIEAQYFALKGVADVLAAHLKNPTGPEIIVVTNGKWQGWVERAAMGGKRDWLLAHLMSADEHRRLGFFYPITGGEREKQIKVHSKVIIIDDQFLRIGSSNLNERSAGLDTECDITIEATDPVARSCIQNIRLRLVSEHTGLAPEALEDHIRRRGSLLDSIRAAPRNGRQLKPLPRVSDTTAAASSLGSLLDPGEPLTFGRVFRLLGLRG